MCKPLEGFACLANIGFRKVLEIVERGSAREAVKLAVFIAPIGGAIGLDQSTANDPDRIVAVELALEVLWRVGLPKAGALAARLEPQIRRRVSWLQQCADDCHDDVEAMSHKRSFFQYSPSCWLTEMLLQARNRVEYLFRQCRIRLFDVGQQGSPDVLDLLQAEVRLLDLCQGRYDYARVATHEFAC
jgi:hypothetical protein